MSTSSTRSSTSIPWHKDFGPWRSNHSSTTRSDPTSSNTELDLRIQGAIDFIRRIKSDQPISQKEKEEVYASVKELKNEGFSEELKGDLSRIKFTPGDQTNKEIGKIRYLLKNRFINNSDRCSKVCDSRFVHHIFKSIRGDWGKAIALATLLISGSIALYSWKEKKDFQSGEVIFVGGSIGIGLTLFLALMRAGYKAFRDNP